LDMVLSVAVDIVIGWVLGLPHNYDH